MRLNIAFAAAALVCATSVQGAHWAKCTNNKDGSGGTNYQVTKDCCAATKEHSSTAFNEAARVCQDGLGFGNGINLGRFVACCGSRGAGSQGN